MKKKVASTKMLQLLIRSSLSEEADVSRLLQVTLGNSRQPKRGLLTISIRRQGGIVRDFELEFLPIMPPQQPHRAPRARATRP
jgi:hypothetical protein